MLAAPLIAGNDLRNMDQVTWEILTNREVIEIDQDRLGISAKKVIDEGEFEVFVKPLQNDELSVCLFNRKEMGVDLVFDWKQLDLDQVYQLRDLWLHKMAGSTDDPLRCHIPRHGVKHFRLFQADLQTN